MLRGTTQVPVQIERTLVVAVTGDEVGFSNWVTRSKSGSRMIFGRNLPSISHQHGLAHGNRLGLLVSVIANLRYFLATIIYKHSRQSQRQQSGR